MAGPSSGRCSSEGNLLAGMLQPFRYTDGQDPVVTKPGAYAYGPAKLPHTVTCKGAAARTHGKTDNRVLEKNQDFFIVPA